MPLPLCVPSCQSVRTTWRRCVRQRWQRPQPAVPGSTSPCGWCVEACCSPAMLSCGPSSPRLSGTAPHQPGPPSLPPHPTSSPQLYWGGWYLERPMQFYGGWASLSLCVGCWCFMDPHLRPCHRRRAERTSNVALADHKRADAAPQSQQPVVQLPLGLLLRHWKGRNVADKKR